MVDNPAAKPARVTRAELYDHVWSQPMIRLAVEYRVTATALAKTIRKANIPVPPRGYWNKLQNGKPVIKMPPLPPVKVGARETFLIQPSSPTPRVDPVVEARAAAERIPENRIHVPECQSVL